MTTFTLSDYRALCAELLKEWDAANGDQDLLAVADVIGRIRTILSQPEPEEAKSCESAVAKTVLPVFSDEKIDELWDQEGEYFALYEEARRFARALIPLVCKTS